jgi:hypothetical protein
VGRDGECLSFPLDRFTFPCPFLGRRSHHTSLLVSRLRHIAFVLFSRTSDQRAGFRDACCLSLRRYLFFSLKVFFVFPGSVDVCYALSLTAWCAGVAGPRRRHTEPSPYFGTIASFWLGRLGSGQLESSWYFLDETREGHNGRLG